MSVVGFFLKKDCREREAALLLVFVVAVVLGRMRGTWMRNDRDPYIDFLEASLPGRRFFMAPE